MSVHASVKVSMQAFARHTYPCLAPVSPPIWAIVSLQSQMQVHTMTTRYSVAHLTTWDTGTGKSMDTDKGMGTGVGRLLGIVRAVQWLISYVSWAVAKGAIEIMSQKPALVLMPTTNTSMQPGMHAATRLASRSHSSAGERTLTDLFVAFCR